MAELTRLRKKQSANRNVVKGLIVKAKGSIAGDRTTESVGDVAAYLKTIRSKEVLLEELSDKMCDLVEEEKIDEVVEDAANFEVLITKDLRLMEQYIQPIKDAKETKTVPEVLTKIDSVDVRSKVQLPKLVIKKFTGDPTCWQQFSELFEASVGSRSDLSDIEKFSYLKGNIGGDAEKCIEGMELTNTNYPLAKQLLKDRFGNPQLIIQSHMQKFMMLKRIKSGRNVKDLRTLLDQMESGIRSLQSVGVQQDHYGPMLIPVLLEKIPDEIILDISRTMPKGGWKIQDFVTKFRDDVTARESCFLMTSATIDDESDDKGNRKQTTGALTTTTTSKGAVKCIFCSASHYSDKCTVVTDPNERHDIAKNQKLCFKCLSKGHSIKSCKNKRNCYNCKKSNHHTALCPTPRERPRTEDTPPIANPDQTIVYNSPTGMMMQNPTGMMMQPVGTHVTGAPLYVQPPYMYPGQFYPQTNTMPSAPGIPMNAQNSSTSTSTTMHVSSSTAILLQTAKVTITDIHGLRCTPTEIRIIFDLCSQRTYISNRIVELLQLTPFDTKGYVVNSFGDQKGQFQQLGQYKFCLKSAKRNSSIEVTGSAVPFICAPLSDQRIDLAKENVPFLKTMDLSDSGMGGDDEPIEVLLGADYYWSIVSDEKRRCGIEGLVAQNSKVGWLLSGPCESLPSSSNMITTNFVSRTIAEPEGEDELLSQQVERFNDLESLGIEENEVSVYDKFLEKVTFKKHRYCVELPFKEDFPRVDDNYAASVACLKKLKEKLDENPELRQQYDDIMKKQLDLGILERVKSDPIPDHWTTLPHRAVVKPDRLTTKVRVVYNCSFRMNKKKKCGMKQKYTNLNECIYKGPNLTPLIYDVRLKFRAPPIALSADIEAAYHQIEVVPKHRDYMRVLWYDDVTAKNPKIIQLRFTRVIFGASSSSFLLDGVVRLHAENYRAEDPSFPEMIGRSLYADDFNGGAVTVQEGKMLYDKIKWRYLDASFNFRKWRTNNEELKSYIDSQEKMESSIGHIEGEKTLGIIWDEKRDVLIIPISDFMKDAESIEPTKRNVVKILARVYDPVGYIMILTVKLKILFQYLCASNVDWDTTPDDHVKRRFSDVVTDFRDAKDLVIPRRYCEFDSIASVELHGFSDSSKKAYGVCIYLKFVSSSGQVSISFVTSKSRLTPLRKLQTLARLELLGILVMSKLAVTVMNALKDEFDIAKQIYWSDSTVAIGWCKAEDKEFNTFVQNRVTRIRSTIDVSELRHCAGDQNPADLITRENNKIDDELFWKAPSFLQQNDYLQKNDGNDLNYDDKPGFNDEIKKQNTSLHTGVVNDASIGLIMDIDDYGNLLKLFRITAYVKRFINNLKASRDNKPLCLTKYVNSLEMKEARILWIKQNQKSFSDKRLKELCVDLNVRCDDVGVLRSYSRLKHAKIPQDTKSPVLINPKHKLAELIVDHAHTRVLHRGVKQTLTETRTAYWIPRGRNFVRKLVRPCVVCKRLHARAYKYPGHSDLPEFRLDDGTPFKATGVDYLGPLYCREVYSDPKSASTHKCWIAIYTCATTRAVILDVVHDARAPTFIDSFKRFISRRGCPNTMISDHGTVFTAKETQSFASNRFINWKFTLECAPWFGGMWERLVASVKRCLKKVIGVKVISYTELQTLLFQVESILNNRPIDADYDDDCEEVLTPNHLVFGRRLETMNHGDEVEFDANDTSTPIRRKRLLDTMLNHFWQRWRKEYLTSLRQYQRQTNINKGSQQVRVGDVVLIFAEKQPRHLWEIGRIMKLIESKDGKIRGAEVKVGRTGALINRPITKLYPIVSDKSAPVQTTPDINTEMTSNIDSTIHTSDTTDNSITEVIDPLDDIKVSNELSNEGKLFIRDDRENSTEATPTSTRRVRRNAAIMGELKRRLHTA